MNQAPLQTVCDVMEARGHDYRSVYDFMGYLISLTIHTGKPTKLQSYLDAGPDAFEQAFIAWHEREIEKWQQLRIFIEEMR